MDGREGQAVPRIAGGVAETSQFTGRIQGDEPRSTSIPRDGGRSARLNRNGNEMSAPGTTTTAPRRSPVDERSYHDLMNVICLTTAASICPKIRPAVTYIEHNYHRRLTLECAGAQIGYHPNHLCRVFREQLELSFHEYLLRARLKKAIRLLVYTYDPIKEVGYRVGFVRPQQFSRVFTRWLHSSPRVFREQYRYQ